MLPVLGLPQLPDSSTWSHVSSPIVFSHYLPFLGACLFPPFCKDTNRIGLGLTLVTSSYLITSVSKEGHILRSWGARAPMWNSFWGGDTVQAITSTKLQPSLEGSVCWIDLGEALKLARLGGGQGGVPSEKMEVRRTG